MSLGDVSPLDESRLTAMRDAMTHRGPDDAGEYLAAGVALGSRRLAILDLSPAGHMPMHSPDGRYVIVHNGEVYNFADIRRDLEARGRTFRSGTDTEVLLHGFAEYGPALLERCNGMFGFAVWDTREKSLFLARDRLGVKPVYYAEHQGRLLFASEEKALFAAGVPAEFDPEVWEELLCFRYVAGERTPFKGVKRLLPGHYLVWRQGDISIRPWWRQVDRIAALRSQSPAEAAAWYRDTFDDAVALRRISDVPVGVLLSGGLDSTTVAASLARHKSAEYVAFTMRFAEADYDEGPLAEKVARQCGFAFDPIVLPPETLVERLERASWYSDEPLAHGNDVHLWAVAEHAKRRVTVLLSGEGSDETNGGYVRYRPLRYPRLLSAAAKLLPMVSRSSFAPARLKKLHRLTSLGGIDRAVLYNSCDAFPGELASLGMRPTGLFPYRERLLSESQSLYPREPMRQAMYGDQHTFLCSLLDRNDRMTMAASIECRVPFLDYRLVEGLAAMPSAALFPSSKSKSLLRNALGSRLPPEILTARKWGFGVPWSSLMRNEPAMREIVESLPTLEPIASGPFDRNAVRATVAAFLAGDDVPMMLVRQLFLTAVWHRAYFQRLRSGASTN